MEFSSASSRIISSISSASKFSGKSNWNKNAIEKLYTVKKAFPVPGQDVTYQALPGRE